MEADPSCRYDYLNIYNGHSESSQRLARVCGTFRPGTIMSTGPQMMLEMGSDEETGGRGFIAWYSAGAPALNGETVTPGVAILHLFLLGNTRILHILSPFITLICVQW